MKKYLTVLLAITGIATGSAAFAVEKSTASTAVAPERETRIIPKPAPKVIPHHHKKADRAADINHQRITPGNSETQEQERKRVK